MSQQPIKFHLRKPTERIKTVAEVKDVLFSELKVLNVILTNACNLSCSYCFEQHKKDYGKFTQEQLKQVYDFLVGANDLPNRNFQFFGGEPLAQKAKILEFCRTYKDELSANKEKVRVSIVTNALLLTPEFMEEYCSYDFTSLVISLDTDNEETNRRELTEENINYIFDMIKLIPDYMMRENHHCAIRCTINEESVPHLRGFMHRLYVAGVRNFVIHPLIMGREQGVVEWVMPASENFRNMLGSDNFTSWDEMTHELKTMMNGFPDFKIHWAEGVGVKGESNCMVGSDMIAMDASGDFSGCYFFTNLKETAGHTMLGNLFRDEIYIDRYVNFQNAYVEALEHEECKSCHLKNFCYQCPAGNISTGDKLFRPDGMCKRIVQLFIDLREHANKRAMHKKLADINTAMKAEGEIVLSRAVLHLLYKRCNGTKLDTELVNGQNVLPRHRSLLAFFKKHYNESNLPPLNDFLDEFHIKHDGGSLSGLMMYTHACKAAGIPAPFGVLDLEDPSQDAVYITLMHLLVMDNSAYLNKYDPEHSRSQILDL